MLKRLSIAEERASTLKREFDAAQNELDEARKRVAAHGELEEAARIDEERRIDKKLQCAVTPINQLVRNAWKWIESERPGAFHCYNRACTQMTASGYFRCRFDHDVTFCEVCIDHGKLLDLAGMAREWRPNLMDYWCKQSCLPSYQCELHDDQVGRAAAYNEWLMLDNDKEDCTDKPYCAMSCLGLSAEPTHGNSSCSKAHQTWRCVPSTFSRVKTRIQCAAFFHGSPGARQSVCPTKTPGSPCSVPSQCIFVAGARTAAQNNNKTLSRIGVVLCVHTTTSGNGYAPNVMWRIVNHAASSATRFFQATARAR